MSAIAGDLASPACAPSSGHRPRQRKRKHPALLNNAPRSPFFDGFWDARGWGLGLSIVTARDAIADVPGRYRWDGAFSSRSTSIGARTSSAC